MEQISVLISWLVENMEWLFGGLGVSVVSWIFFKKKDGQVQKSGNNSFNVQVGKSLNIRNNANAAKNRK